ncbi:MAG: (Fe-S)-binding protein [Planctomycetota bacterium]
MNSNALLHLPTIDDCVHCGLCLGACPTYEVTGKESESPRGRIAALRALSEERIALSPAIARGLDDCLVCRACESACPSGISMESLIGGYRATRRQAGATWSDLVEGFALREIVAHPERLARAGRLFRWIAPLLRRWPSLFELPQPARVAAAAMTLDAPPPPPPARGRVVIFTGCISRVWFRAELNASARVLARNGWQVEFARGMCCGALHHHTGLVDEARRLKRECALALDESQPDFIVCDTAGCAATLAGAPKSPVVDTCTLLEREGWDPPAEQFAGNWVVAPPCHQRHGAIPEHATRAVLARILAHGYRELPPPDHCCGAAGLYVVRRPRLSRAIGAAALARFRHSNSDGVLAANSGCLMRWEKLLARPNGAGRALHPVVALDQCYARAAGRSAED